jgi:hypothetical protein
MSLTDRLNATSRRPTATVRVNSQRWDDWLSLSREQSYGGNISGGDATGRALPAGVDIGTPISWSWGYDGVEVAGFSGVVTAIDTDSYPNRVGLKVADPLWKASRQQKDIATSPLNSIAASTAITQILSGAGLTKISIPALAASGSKWAGGEWVLGTLTPVAFANSTALAAAQRIAETLGYWLYADASGVARAVLLERRPSDSPFRTLRWGVDFVIAGTPSRRQPDTRKNRVVVRGANTGVQGAQIKDAWQDDPGDRSEERTFELIEFVNEAEAGAASATGVAKRVLRLLNRDPNIIEIPRLKADPRIAVGMTIAVQCAKLGYSSPRPFFVYSLSSKLDRLKGDFAQSLTLDGGVGDQGYTTMPPPEASFSWRLVRETLNGVGVVEVFLDGTGSLSLGGGEIVSWAWTTATTVASGYASTATGPKAMFVYPAATATAVITLTVMDTSSKTGSITQTITLAGDATTTVNTRVISLALGAAWAVTPDGGATWRVEATGDSTLVPEASDSGLISTRATGSTGLRSSADALATASTNLASLGGAITALAQTVGYPLRVWAAVGAALYRSIDGGATFAAWGTLPASVSAVLEDPAVLNSVFVLAGANLYHATTNTPGTGWSVLYAGPSGAAARHLVRGGSGATTWIAYTGTFIGSPLQRVEGPISASFPLTTSPAVAEIRAIALSPDELSVYAWDAQGRTWRVDSATGVATASTAALGATETAQHALHDPDDSIVYLATFGATAGTTYKYFPLADSLAAFYVPASGRQSHRVGLGAPAPQTAVIYVLSKAMSGAADGIHRYAAGAWARIVPPQTNWYWRYLLVSPFNRDHLLLCGNTSAIGTHSVVGGVVKDYGGTASPLYVSTDGGATWASVTLAGFPGSGTQLPDVFPLWSATAGGEFVVVGQTGPNVGSYLWRLTAASPSGTAVQISATVNHYYGAAGQDADLVTPAYTQAGASARTIDYVRSSGAFVAGSVAASGEWTWIGRLPGTRQIVGQNGTGLYRVADYRASSAPVLLASGIGGRGVALTADAAYVGGSGGLTEVSGLATSPAASVVALAGVGVAAVASDAATRTAVAGLSNSNQQIALRVGDTGAWQIIGTPAGVTLADWIEVVAL